jgi:hypothetical protein
MNSLRLPTPSLASTATTTGEEVSGATGAKSASGSNGMSFTVYGLIATLPTWICASV